MEQCKANIDFSLIVNIYLTDRKCHESEILLQWARSHSVC